MHSQNVKVLPLKASKQKSTQSVSAAPACRDHVGVRKIKLGEGIWYVL